MQDKILLGFLMEKEKITSYDAKKMMELSTSFFYTTSLGSINPAFKKLEKSGQVTSIQVVENGRMKIYYSITEKGKEAFNSWLTEEIEVSKIKENLLLKVFFFSHIPRYQKKNMLDDYLNKVEKHIEKLESMKFFCSEQEIDNEHYDTLKFGIDYYHFLHNWFAKYVQEI